MVSELVCLVPGHLPHCRCILIDPPRLSSCNIHWALFTANLFSTQTQIQRSVQCTSHLPDLLQAQRSNAGAYSLQLHYQNQSLALEAPSLPGNGTVDGLFHVTGAPPRPRTFEATGVAATVAAGAQHTAVLQARDEWGNRSPMPLHNDRYGFQWYLNGTFRTPPVGPWASGQSLDTLQVRGRMHA